MKNATLRWMALALAAACAGGKQETKTAQGAPPPAENPPAPAAVPPKPSSPAPSTVGKTEQKAPDTGTVSAAQAAAPSAPAAAEPPLMPDQEFRAHRPAALAVQPRFEAPVPVQKRLKNGARLLIVENHQIPLVAVDVRFLHGVDADPADRPGLAEFVSDTVDEGTASRSAEQLAVQIENLAAHLSSGAGLESATVHLNCLSETLPQALELLADVVQHPAFRKEDVERVRVLKLTGLEQKKASISALAADEADKLLFGPSHPWGKPSGGTP